MNNKPMLSVERELLEDMLNPCADFATHERLRALLDNPDVQRSLPVAWIKKEVVETLIEDECCYAFGRQSPAGTLIPLYAEQPTVAMPERKTKADYSGYIEPFQSEAAAIYNSALEDVGRLNGRKV